MTDGVILDLTQVNPPLKIKVRHDRCTEIVERCSHRDRDYGRYYPPDSAAMAKTLKEQGTIAFWLQHDHDDWSFNEYRYDFGPFTFDKITMRAVKHPDRTLEVTFDGPLGRTLTANTDMPQYDPEGVLVALSWQRLKAKLYLQGRLVETKDISRRTLH